MMTFLIFLSVVAIVTAVVSGTVEETVAAMTATFRNPRFCSPATISEEKVKSWRVLGTGLAPTVTTVSSDLPAENAFHEWPGAFIGASGNEQATLFLPFYYSSSPSPKFKIVAAYHIVPEKIVYSDLLSKVMFSRLPTLVPGTSIVVTNTSYSRFTLDDVLLVKPDLFVSSSIVIHGIDSPLDFTRNGGFGGGETDTSSFLVIATAIAIRSIRLLEFPH